MEERDEYEPGFTSYRYTCRPCHFSLTSDERHKGELCHRCGKPMREKNLNPKPRKKRKKIG
jgi:transcription initiation factor IIE alpha subunit